MSKTENYEAENELIVVTREQKELLENLLDNLGISVKDFLELRKIKKFKVKTEKEIKDLKEQNKLLSEELKNQMENLVQLNNRLSNLESLYVNSAKQDSIFDALNNSDEKDGDI